ALGDPPPGFSEDDLHNVVLYAIFDQGLPVPGTYPNDGIYAVFTPPGIRSAMKDDPDGYHDALQVPVLPLGFEVPPNVTDLLSYFKLINLATLPAASAWVSTAGPRTFSDTTETLSHEVVEAITDPFINTYFTLGNGITARAGSQYPVQAGPPR